MDQIIPSKTFEIKAGDNSCAFISVIPDPNQETTPTERSKRFEKAMDTKMNHDKMTGENKLFLKMGQWF